MVSYVAIPYQIYTLTGSNFAVGAIGLVELVPIVVFGLYGGALADHVDRRRLLIWTGVAQAVFTARARRQRVPRRARRLADLRGGVLPGRDLVAAAAVARGADAAHGRRTTSCPRPTRCPASACSSACSSGPAVGGLLVAYVGIGWCFVIDIGGLAVATLLYVLMRLLPAPRGDHARRACRASGRACSYAFSRRDLLGTYLVDIAAMMLAIPVVLFPALVEEVFERPELLGLLYSAETVGALVATALSGWTSRVHHHGRAIVIAAAVVRR